MVVLCRHVAPDADPGELAACVAGYGPELVYSSPLERAVRTAEAVAARCSVPLVLDDRVREIDFGDVEGLGFDELPPDLQRGLLEEPARVRFPGGETYAELRARVTEALAELVKRHERLAVISHAGAIRAALAAWLDLGDHAVWRIDQRPGAVNVVDLIDGYPVIRLLNG
jgi:broad specificity phosphatase PhoE